MATFVNYTCKSFIELSPLIINLLLFQAATQTSEKQWRVRKLKAPLWHRVTSAVEMTGEYEDFCHGSQRRRLNWEFDQTLRIRSHDIGGGSRNFWLGGTKLWFGKDCWTFLWQITSPLHLPHHLPPVAVARYNSLSPYRVLLCVQRRTDHRRVPKNNYIFEHPWNLL